MNEITVRITQADDSLDSLEMQIELIDPAGEDDFVDVWAVTLYRNMEAEYDGYFEIATHSDEMDIITMAFLAVGSK